MSFNVQELEKIGKATSGWLKGNARRSVAEALATIAPSVEQAKTLPGSERKAALKELLDHATAARHEALKSGANSYSHPAWAAAAACESWLQALLLGDEEIARVEQLISELRAGK